MTNELTRAELISVIWSLKIAIGKKPGAVSGVDFIHFNSMLRDEDYRCDVLSAAARSGDAEVRRLAEQAQELNMPGQLVRRPDKQAAAKAEVAAPAAQPAQTEPAPQQSETPQDAPAPLRRPRIPRPAWAVVALTLFTGIAMGVGQWLGDQRLQVISGSIAENTVWDADHEYQLQGLVFVESGAILTVEPGTRVRGVPGSALVVTRDGRINAQGSRRAPIVFTSSKPVGQRKRGDWGGVVLLGNAPVNTGVGRIEGISEDDPRGGFGGGAAEESCGVLKYVRIEFAGYEISQDNELNGLTLGGCGRGTILDHVQVHKGLDDGIEFFGGTANLKHIVISHAGDDGLDWDRGWQGNGQFIIVQQGADDGDNGIEADNYSKDKDAQPRSAPTLSNVTLVGSGDPRIAQRGLLLRRGTGGDLRNFLVTDFTSEALDIRDKQTAQLLQTGELGLKGWLVARAKGEFFSVETGEGDDDGGLDEQSLFDAQSGNRLITGRVLSEAAHAVVRPDFTPSSRSAAASGYVPVPQGEFWDEAANFIGAVRPGERVSWLEGWTDFPEN